jgi:hypothetical protein
VDGDLFLERDVLLVSVVHRSLDSRIVPFGTIPQDVACQHIRLLEANAAVTQGAPRPRKQCVGRRVVQVDVVLVRKQELHVAERVAGPGQLAERECLDRRLVVPVHAARIHHLGAAVRPAQDLDVIARQEIGNRAPPRVPSLPRRCCRARSSTG